MSREIHKGERFGRWSAVRSASKDHHGRARTVVRCLCGTEAIVLDDALRRGHTSGCRSVVCRRRWEESRKEQT